MKPAREDSGSRGPATKPDHEPTHAAPAPTPPALSVHRIAADLAIRRRVLLDAARRLRRDADPEAVHDLRVACRRLDAAHRLWEAWLAPGAGRKVAQALRRLRRQAGDARDLEVLIEQVKRRAHDAKAPDVARALEDEAMRLERRLPKARRAVVDRVQADRMRRLDRAGRRAARRLHEAACGAVVLPVESLSTAAVEQAASHGRAAASAWREAVRFPSDARLHEARIRIKRWRYALEGLEAGGCEGLGVRLGRLRDLQRVLGDLQDLAVLRDHLERRARKRRLAALRAEIAVIDTERNERIEALRRERRGRAASRKPAGRLAAVPPLAIKR